MVTIQRGVPLVQRAIARLKTRTPAPGEDIVGASGAALDALESKLMVELPPTLREFLAFDFTFASFGKRWRGRHRFGTDPRAPRPKITSVRKLAEAMTDLGWTDSRLRGKVVRLPNLPGHAWNALYLGETRRDGELPILGLDHEETNVRVFPRYTAFDLYLADQSGLYRLPESARLDDLESHVAVNPELGSGDDEEEREPDY
jgi:hypothetical protein